jgi:hypothetical protein
MCETNTLSVEKFSCILFAVWMHATPFQVCLIVIDSVGFSVNFNFWTHSFHAHWVGGASVYFGVQDHEKLPFLNEI